jgi:NAD(P)-dependent dehydrogenase (short-subunit alcohol dehydrogenase family)
MSQKTVLISGASSGIGRAAAEHFQKKGWNVAAGMRSPEDAGSLADLPCVLCPALDVTDAASISRTLGQVLDAFGSVDVLVNNAGYGLRGPFEGASDEQIRHHFETNVFGLMALTKAVLPHFRARKQGVIVNVASMGGRLTFPMYSLYHGTKWAVEGFSESLSFEVAPLGILVKIVEPGIVKTDFYGRSSVSTAGQSPADYARFVAKVEQGLEKQVEKGTGAQQVAERIFHAANDRSDRIRYPVGSDAKGLLMVRRLIGDRRYMRLVKRLIAR